MASFEGFLERSGQFGPYQWRHYALAAGNWIPAAFLTWSSVFANMRPHWRLVTSPGDAPPETGPLPCDSPGSYVIVDAWQSVAGEWGLVCGDAWKSTLLDEFFFVGFGVGAAGFGTFADRYGRRRATLLTTGVAALFTVASAASQSLVVYGILRGLAGIGVGGMGVCCYVWASEAVGPRWQGITGVTQAALFAAGEALLVLVSLSFPGWRSLTLFTGAFTAVWMLLLLTLQESPRWLLLQQRAAEARAILLRMAVTNGASEANAAGMADTLIAGTLRAGQAAAAQVGPAVVCVDERGEGEGGEGMSPIAAGAAACDGGGDGGQGRRTGRQLGSEEGGTAEGATIDLIGTGLARSDDDHHVEDAVHARTSGPERGSGDTAGSTDGLGSLFQYPLLHRTLPMLLAWCVASFVYYGLSLNSGNVRCSTSGHPNAYGPVSGTGTLHLQHTSHPFCSSLTPRLAALSPCPSSLLPLPAACARLQLGGSLHVNFALSALVEIPADLGGGWLIELACLGRRGTLAGALIFGGIACLACAPLSMAFPPASPAVNASSLDGALGAGDAGGSTFGPAQAAALAGKFAVSAAFSLVFVYCAELFPTSVRNLAVGLSSTAARVGGVAAPAVVLLGTVDKQLPTLVFASAALLSGAYCCTLPETRGRPSPETIEEIRRLW